MLMDITRPDKLLRAALKQRAELTEFGAEPFELESPKKKAGKERKAAES